MCDPSDKALCGVYVTLNPPVTVVTATPGLVLVKAVPPSTLITSELILIPDPFVSSLNWNDIAGVLLARYAPEAGAVIDIVGLVVSFTYSFKLFPKVMSVSFSVTTFPARSVASTVTG